MLFNKALNLPKTFLLMQIHTAESVKLGEDAVMHEHKKLIQLHLKYAIYCSALKV